MAIIDMRTIAIVFVIINLICTLFLTLLWVQNRKRYPSIGYWVIDISLQTIAMFLIAVRGFIPDWLSIFVATSLIIIGSIAGYLATAYFFLKKPKLWVNVIFLGCFVCIHGYFVFIYPSLAIRSLNLAFFLVLINLECLLTMSRNIDPLKFSSLGALRASYALFIVINAVRVVDFFVDPTIKSDYFESAIFDKFILSAYLVATLILIIGIILMVNKRLIIEIQDQNELNLEQSKRDPLTNIYNRKYVAEQLQLLVDGYVQADRCAAVAILDLDYFKRVNDTYGHFAGDATLIELTQVIQANIRAGDILGRQGGEEFIIDAANTTKEALKQMIDRILEIVADQPVRYQDHEIPYAFSGGVTDCRDFSRESISVDQLIVKADNRMYLAKTNGRKQVLARD